jgi:circadian clock protein KaiC
MTPQRPKKSNRKQTALPQLPKCPTGITGLDEITGGGLPQGRCTLVCGNAGSGKTLLGMEFLVRGITDFGEPGVCISFEESAADLAQNVASLGFDLPSLSRRKKLHIDYVQIEKREIEETGEYDLEGLFVRIGSAIQEVGAKRVLLDTIEALFAGLSNDGILRAELRRLFGWLKAQGVTTIVTGERGDTTLTRHGLEEYISDCVIVLDHRMWDSILTRRLRIAKYRGTTHGTNEYPFLIGPTGISVLPITSLALVHPAPTERISTGIAPLDQMLDGKGYFRGSTILLSGTAGTGKTSVAANLLVAAARRGERCLLFSFEESLHQVTRNMRSIGIDLEPLVKDGTLRCEAFRATTAGLEMHLLKMQQEIEEFNPRIVVLDPISALIGSGAAFEVKTMLLRLLDFLKQREVTTLLTFLASSAELQEAGLNMSSFVDVWILLKDIESNGERNRGLHILKARGMAHSNQVREMLMTGNGILLRDVYLGPNGVVTGSARVAQEAVERDQAIRRKAESERLKSTLVRKRADLADRIASLRRDFQAEETEIAAVLDQAKLMETQQEQDRLDMARSRRVDPTGPSRRKGATR